MASQVQFDGHVRKTRWHGRCGQRDRAAKQLLDSGAITQAEFGGPVAAGRLSRASLAHNRRPVGAVTIFHSIGSRIVFCGLLNKIMRERSRDAAVRARMHVPVAMVAVVALVALAGCGSSKPAYCSDRTNLNNAVKNLPSVTSSSGISGLTSQIATIQSDATSLVNAAKSDFPTETSAVKTSVDTLKSAVKALPSSPSASQIAAIALDAGNVVSSVKSFADTSKSKCS